jgi:Icc-related predicted phosphoesterase
VIRIAAVGDVHVGADSAGTLRPHFERLRQEADVLLLAGDLTTCGEPHEADVLVQELADVEVPVLAVLGNHDYHLDRAGDVRAVLERGGLRVLEGDGAVVPVNGARLGVAGVKGFGGGFAGAHGTEFGEPEMKAFIRHTKLLAQQLTATLDNLQADAKVALLHYSPIRQTLLGERLELYPFLGSYLLAEAVDQGGADLCLHGHAHRGKEKGATPGGVHVRNVAQSVLRRAYGLYHLGDRGSGPGV